MAKRNLFAVLLVMILLILLTTENTPSAASTNLLQSESQEPYQAVESGTATHPESRSGGSTNQPGTILSSGGGSLHLIK
jgi:hypothetical protein